MSDGSFVIGATPQPADGDIISLNLGLDTTGGLASFIVPEGTHKFQAMSFEVDYTKNGEVMINLVLKAVESNVTEAMGQEHTERLVIPGDERKQNDPGSWKTMMKMLRLKLEALTGKTWRDDNLQLRPKELIGCLVIATVVHKVTSVDPHDGTKPKEYTNATLTNWQAVLNTAQQQVPGTGVIGSGFASVGSNSDPTTNVEPF